ncbi:MAG: DNA polymerase I [Desulfobulbus propionicus]|nr:MAG: DNA polymerase I [Desulfobulbus propionicus]
MATAKIYLVDGNAYIYRSYHAIKALSNSSGLPTNATYGFVSMLKKLITERKPDYLAVAFDSKGPVFRHEMYAEYKANRPPMPDDLVPQVPFIHSLVQGYNITTLIEKGQEADDLIASAAMTLVRLGHEIVIVSGDKDLLQLVSSKVTLWDPVNDREMDEGSITRKYGVQASQLLDYFALTGDSSDNIPGVPGVGPKTAQRLINSYQTLEELYAHVHELKASKMKERIIANKEQAFLSRQLVALNHQATVPAELEQYRRLQPDDEKLRALFSELEFHSFLKKDVFVQAAPVEHFHLVQSEKELDQVCLKFNAAETVVIDTETDSLNPDKANLVGLSLCFDNTSAWYIPCGHRDDKGELLPGQLQLTLIISRLRPLLAASGRIIIGHNIKFDYRVLSASQNGALSLGGHLFDTMIGAWLIDPGRRSYKLDDLCAEMNLRMTSFDEVVKGDRRPDAFCRVKLEDAKHYSCEDVYGTWMLYTMQKETLEQWTLLSHMLRVEGSLVKILAGMESSGVKVDKDALHELAEEFGDELDRIEKQVHNVAGKTFNIQSPKQLGDILFAELKLPKGRKTKTGWSTDVSVLEKLVGYHELPGLVLQYRNLAKLKSTYIDKLAGLLDDKTARVHTSYNQCGTATGRLSSSNPNLQNIPIRTEEGRRIRAAFITEPGWVLISADYSQIDLRVMAHYSQDKTLLEAFERGEDIHRQTASQIFFVAPSLVTQDMRRVAKTINFGIVYGMSSFGLSRQLDISRKEAQTFIDRYFAHYEGIQMFMEETVAKARANGYVTTLTGRKRMLPEISSKNRTRREFAERIAINTPIQGTAADIMKLAMLKVDKALQRSGSKAKMILQIHDELILETPQSEQEQISSLLLNSMESAVQLDVPLKANVCYGQTLGKE